MEYYGLVKHIHMSAASLSLLGFMLRGYWMLRESPLLQAKLSKILPHIIDTALLASAIYLFQAYSLDVNWITAKIALLVAYIITGTIAIKRGKTKTTRVIALIVSIAIILSIFAIAAIKPWS
jgi:uncharacterized membrane protein SirB2